MKKLCAVGALVLLMCGAWAGVSDAARSGGTLNFVAPYGGDLLGLDPHKSTRVQDFLVMSNINRSLYSWEPGVNKPKLELATKADVSADGKVWTFKLRDDVKFHNGRKMTADDIIYSYNRLASPATKSPSTLYVRIIKGAKDVEDGKAQTIAGLRKLDDSTLQITLENPVDLPYFLFYFGTAIVPKEEVEKKGDGFASDPVGCGPFQFVKWVKGSEVVIKKFPGYYVAGRPYLDKVVFKIMTESQARDNAFRAKELDATIVEPVQYPVYKKDPAISKNIIEVAEMFTRVIGFNMDKEPFKKKEVRQAINYAIDRNLIIEKLLHGKAVPAVSWLPSTSAAFNPKAKGYEYNPEKAVDLMKKAGYEKGFTVQAIGTSNPSWGTIVFEAAMPYLKKININLNIQQMEGATLVDRLLKGEFEMFSYSMGTGPEPLQALRRWKGDTSRSAGNYANYRNADYDKALDQAAAERDEAKRIALLQRADGILLDDAALMFFNYNKAVMAYQPWVQGFKANAVDMVYQDMASVWVEEASPRAKEQ
jgi:peptide/nickel transport system substrate-binding protein